MFDLPHLSKAANERLNHLVAHSQPTKEFLKIYEAAYNSEIVKDYDRVAEDNLLPAKDNFLGEDWFSSESQLGDWEAQRKLQNPWAHSEDIASRATPTTLSQPYGLEDPELAEGLINIYPNPDEAVKFEVKSLKRAQYDGESFNKMESPLGKQLNSGPSGATYFPEEDTKPVSGNPNISFEEIDEQRLREIGAQIQGMPLRPREDWVQAQHDLEAQRRDRGFKIDAQLEGTRWRSDGEETEILGYTDAQEVSRRMGGVSLLNERITDSKPELRRKRDEALARLITRG